MKRKFLLGIISLFLIPVISIQVYADSPFISSREGQTFGWEGNVRWINQSASNYFYIINQNKELWKEHYIFDSKAQILNDVESIYISSDHHAALTTDGSLWMWEDNGSAQCTDVSTSGWVNVPIKVMDNVKSVSLGRDASAAIKTDGSLWMWGNNGGGVLGNGEKFQYDVGIPEKIMDNVKSVYIYDTTTFAITSDNTLWGWGYNDRGILLKKESTVYITTPVKLMDNVSSVSVSRSDNVLVTKTDGSLWAWGDQWGEPYYGELYNLDVFQKGTTPKKIMDDVKKADFWGQNIISIKKDGSLWIYDNTVTDGYQSVKIAENVADFGAGNDSFTRGMDVLYFIKTDRSLWAAFYTGSEVSVAGQLFEASRDEELLITKILDDIVMIEPIFMTPYFVALKSDGNLYQLYKKARASAGDENIEIKNLEHDVKIPSDKLQTIKVSLNGEGLLFNQSPFIENGRTLVPIRTISEALDFTVTWDNSTQTITIQKDNTILEMQIGNNIMKKNGQEIILDTPPQLVNSQTFVPVRAIVESFQAQIEWDEMTQTVFITI